MGSLRRKPVLIGWLVGYAALLAAIVCSMFWERNSVLSTLSDPTSIADWESWRTDVRQQQANPGPVERKVPKSEEPPALVLMRDYFKVSLIGATFFSSLLYWVMAWFITGAFSAPSK
jgi:hypothetical protein